MNVGVLHHFGEGSCLRLNVLEISELLEIGLEMRRAQVLLEQGKPQRLRVILATERIEHADACIGPFERLEVAVPIGWHTLVEIDERLLRPPSSKQTLRDLGRVGWI